MLTIARRSPRVDTLSTASVRHWCRRLYESVIECQVLVDEHKNLARLDDRLLADIGLTRQQQILECSKSALGPRPIGDRRSIQNRINGPQNW
jgi:uncharacterized protein YjiS (DUF1127 family)